MISLNSSNTTGFYLLGCIYEKKGDLEKSIESFNKAIEADNNNVNALFSRGAVYNMLGNFQKAIDDYYLALEMDSKRKTIYRNLGRVLGLNNEVGETDRTMSPDQSAFNTFNNSKQLDKLDNLNIDGDINHYVYKHLSDLAIRNTSLSLENSKLKLSNGNINSNKLDKLASPLSNTPTKLINNIGMTNEPNYNFSNKHELNGTSKENVYEYNNSKNGNSLSFNKHNIQRSEMMSKGSSFNQISSPTAQTGLPSHYNDHIGREVSEHLENNHGNHCNNDTFNNINNFNNYPSHPNHAKNNSNINITKVEINDNFSKKVDKNEVSGKLVMRTENSPEVKKDKKKTIEKWEVYHAQGYAARKKENYALAIENYTKALNLYPSYFKALFNRGFAYDKVGEYEKAISDYSKAIELEPNNAYAYYNRAISYDKKGDVELTLNDFSYAIRLLPNKIDFYLNRAYAYRKIKDYTSAIHDYSEVIRMEMDNIKGYYNRALCYEKMSKFEESETDLLYALKLEPSNTNVLYHLGNAREKLEKIELATNNYLE